MFAITYIASTLAIIYLVFGLTLLTHWKSPVVRGLVCYLISAALWIGGNAVADVSYSPHYLILVSQITFAAGVLNVFCFLLLIDLIIDERTPSPKRLIFYGIPTTIIFGLAFTKYSILEIAFPIDQPAEISPGFPYSLALIGLILALLYGVIRMVRNIRKEKTADRRMQLLYVCVGLFITASGQILFNLLLPTLGITQLFSVGPLTSIFFVIFCGYAVTRHKFLDIRIVIQRSIVYGFLLALLICFYLITIEITGILFGKEVYKSILFGAGATSIIGVLTVPFIEGYFRKITDRWFFKGSYDFVESTHLLSSILYSARTTDELISRIEETLQKLLRVELVEIRLEGLGQESSTVLISGDSPGLTFPITLENENIGSLIVGRKLSGDKFIHMDHKLLETFVFQAATTFSRARLFQETERHAEELEKKVIERTSELSILQETQRQMMIDISHNLQTPLAAFALKIERLKDQKLNESSFTSLELSLKTLSSFINDLLHLANLEKEEARKEIVYLDILLNDLADEVEIIAEPQNIKVARSIEKFVSILSDQKSIREAVLNIANNSIKYMGSGTSRDIQISLSQDMEGAYITITDTGIGISHPDIERIFERFYRAETSPDAVRGSGLGLAIAKRLIEQQNGKIEVKSKIGEGSTFIIFLPLN
jgi:signal transduction histidine kinase